MSINNRRIGTEEMKIRDFVSKLASGEFLIPSFQREFVWEADDILGLWDSIFRFYPIGSILYWKTDFYLNYHRKLGGCLIGDDRVPEKDKKRVYILDGQQRATALLGSLYARDTTVRDRGNFDCSVYFCAVTGTFFFAHAFNRRRREVNRAFLLKLGDVLEWDADFYKQMRGQRGYTPEVGNNLYQLSRVFSDYKLSFIHIQGYDIPAVRDIFVRINQEGKDLKSMDLMIARTFQNYTCMVEDDL